MELNLQPQAGTCFVTQAVFTEGARVVSFLVRDPGGEFRRYDCLAEAEGENLPPGEVLCRWTRVFKPRPVGVDAERELKMSAESLFLSLTDEGSGDVSENMQLKQFLALMLERKRVLKNRGRSIGGNLVYEHMRSKRMIEVPAGEMDAEFFLSVREKLGLLIKDAPVTVAVAPAAATTAPGEATTASAEAPAQAPPTEPAETAAGDARPVAGEPAPAQETPPAADDPAAPSADRDAGAGESR